MFEELKDYIASHTKEEIQEDWKETPEFESRMTVEEFLQYKCYLVPNFSSSKKLFCCYSSY